MNKLVYTTIFGNYDLLKDPIYVETNIDYICITDDENLKSNVWKFIYENPNIPNKGKNRKYKILAHKYFSQYDQSLYVDGNIQITGKTSPLFDKYLSENNIAITPHPSRSCIYDEFNACIQGHIVDKKIADKQKNKYKNEGLLKNLGLFETNIIFRNHNNPEIKNLMEDRYKEIKKHTHRDQLSFMYVAWKNNLHNKIGVVQESPKKKNKYFKIFPHTNGGKIKYILNMISFRKNYSLFYKFLFFIKIPFVFVYQKIFE